MSGPRVVHVVHGLDAQAGTEDVTRRLVALLAERFETDALVADALPGGVRPRGPRIAREPAALADARVERALVEALRLRRPALVHVQHLSRLGTLRVPQLARAAGVRVVVALHDLFFLRADWNLPHADGLDPRAVARLIARRVRPFWRRPFFDAGRFVRERAAACRAALDAADTLVVPSRFLAAELGRAFGPVLEERARVIPHAVPALPRAAQRAGGGPLHAAFVGNFHRAKGALVFVEAARRLAGAPVALSVIGRADRDGRAAAAAGIRLTGAYTRAELPSRLAGVDVAVLPSIVPEAYGLAVDEALRCGVPVVVTTAGAPRERVEDGREALLVPPGDPAALAAALQRLSRDPDLLARLRAGAATRAGAGEREWAESYARLYDELLAR